MKPFFLICISENLANLLKNVYCEQIVLTHKGENFLLATNVDSSGFFFFSEVNYTISTEGKDEKKINKLHIPMSNVKYYQLVEDPEVKKIMGIRLD